MAATSDWRLYQLYLEFGEAQDRRGRPIEAADAYALALYYARRLNDPARIHECRQLVLARSPNHVAGQAVSAPLFFAQLLMRYPADEVEMTLTAGKPDAASANVALAEDDLGTEALPAERTFQQVRMVRPTYDDAAEVARHHAEPTFDGLPQRPVPAIIAEDVLLADAGLLDELEEERVPNKTTVADLSTAVKALATGTIASGLLLIAYLGYSLYPMLNQVKAGAGFSAADDPDKLVVTDDAEPPQATEPPKTVEVPPQPRVAPTPKPVVAVAESGANMPVSLPDEPIEPAAKVSARPAGDSSRK